DSVSVFFFQAEDGIRDLIVTGVQTCALPILRFINDLDEPYTTPPDQPFLWMGRLRITGGRTNVWGRLSLRYSDWDFKAASHDGRSEERRVGKEWRTRRASAHGTQHNDVTGSE